MFVASPNEAASTEDVLFAAPDDRAYDGRSWRALLQEYNEAPGSNPLGLLPAVDLYTDRTYKQLLRCCGHERLYILSAGWGLVRSDFLLPNYDITFSKARNVERYKRRNHADVYDDFTLPSDMDDPITFFGGRDYVPLFCRLTAHASGARTVHYAVRPGGAPVDAPGCKRVRFERPAFTNWHYQCAQTYIRRCGEHDGKD